MSRSVSYIFLFGLLANMAVCQETGSDAAAMKTAMENSRKFTQPGENHKLLQRFVGNWETATRFVMAGNKGAPSRGTCKADWLMKDRWVQLNVTGPLIGREVKAFTLIGYDNFKQSFVVTSVNDLDTAMNRSEGDLTRDGKTLITYGTIDEYLTGEHDKAVKYVWRFVDEDTIVFEVHDLHIGEDNTMVIEQTLKRVPQ